jgi:hypothetical protein
LAGGEKVAGLSVVELLREEQAVAAVEPVAVTEPVVVELPIPTPVVTPVEPVPEEPTTEPKAPDEPAQ